MIAFVRVLGLSLGLLLGVAVAQDPTRERIREVREEIARLEATLPPAARCTGVAKTGERCKRTTRGKDGRCYQHPVAPAKKVAL